MTKQSLLMQLKSDTYPFKCLGFLLFFSFLFRIFIIFLYVRGYYITKYA